MEISKFFTPDERKQILEVIAKCKGRNSNERLLRMLKEELPLTVERVEVLLIQLSKTTPD